MYLAETTLEKIAQYFKLNELEELYFIENIRERQSELLLKTIYMYFAKYKGKAEQTYLKKLTDDLERENGSKESIEKWEKYLAHELENNPNLANFTQEKMVNFVTDILSNFAQRSEDRGEVEDIIRDYYENIDLAVMALRNGDIQLSQDSPLELTAQSQE